MKWYLDADIILALIKEKDRHQTAATHFLSTHKDVTFVTSNLTCLEIWFYLHKNKLRSKALDAIRAVKAIAEVEDFHQQDLESALILAQEHDLTPADAIHAVLARKTDAIVSSDTAFDRVPSLKKIDFSA